MIDHDAHKSIPLPRESAGTTFLELVELGCVVDKVMGRQRSLPVRRKNPALGGNDAVGLIGALSKALDSSGGNWAFTGALALSFWGAVRNSKDVDVVLAGSLGPVLHALAAAGFPLSPQAAYELQGKDRATSFSVLLPSGAQLTVELIAAEPGQEAASRRGVSRAVRMPFPGVSRGIPVVSAEDLVLFKLLFFRPGSQPFQTNDLKDIEGILISQGKSFDISYVNLALSGIPMASEERRRRVRWFSSALRRHGLIQ